jgi:GxxExxY protein
MNENEIARQIVDAALKVHRAVGPGLLESVHRGFLTHELALRGLVVQRERAIPASYEGLLIETGFSADLIVGDSVIVEVKSIEQVLPVHKKQLLTYLKLSEKRLGLMINFNVALIKAGITRMVNGLIE